MANPSDFTGVPFVMGSIYGERVWRVRTDGTLLSAARKSPWHGGENVAGCERGNRNRSGWGPGGIFGFVQKQYRLRFDKEVTKISGTMAYPNKVEIAWRAAQPRLALQVPVVDWTEIDMDKPIDIPEAIEVWDEGVDYISMTELDSWAEWQGHTFEKCECGFYAFTSEDDPEYMQAGRVLGIIEGYGETLIGTRGFRCSKARILALAPSPAGETDSLVNAILKAHGAMNSLTQVVLKAGSYVQTAASAGTHSRGGRLDIPLPPNNTPASAKDNPGPKKQAEQDAAFEAEIARAMATPVVPVTSDESTATAEINWQAIAQIYPDAVIFDSVEEMRRQFPVAAVAD